MEKYFWDLNQSKTTIIGMLSAMKQVNTIWLESLCQGSNFPERRDTSYLINYTRCFWSSASFCHISAKPGHHCGREEGSIVCWRSSQGPDAGADRQITGGRGLQERRNETVQWWREHKGFGTLQGGGQETCFECETAETIHDGDKCWHCMS